MKRVLILVLLALTLVSVVAQEVKFAVAKDDTIRSVLSRHAGGKVTLQMDSGQEISGTVRMVGDRVVHISELTGKEFYDAVVDIDQVSAVVVRTR